MAAVRRHRQEGRIVDVSRLGQFPRLQRLFVETVDAEPDAARALKIRRLAVEAADEDQTGVLHRNPPLFRRHPAATDRGKFRLFTLETQSHM
ncbi:hypothetical protein [Mesorhizobium sp.]|uniref:hypothetical protein n=1 Tax=Mesorhizobium sp. TaxID=1871066 RepID=UPI00257D6341|nr:hypothetical protein [Mesorhizobium sp.]